MKLLIKRSKFSSSNPPSLIPFNLELKNKKSGQIKKAYCYIDNIENRSKYRNSYFYILLDLLEEFSNYNISSIKSKYEIRVDKLFKLKSLNKCKYSSYNMPIFYRQVNNFDFAGNFMFYGLANNTFSKTFFINIIYEDYDEIRKIKCEMKNVSIILPYINQIIYKCVINEQNIKNLRILDSDELSGIPYDYTGILRDPIETQEAILANYANSKSLSMFKIHNIYCDNKRDILTFIGTIFGEIKESKIFPILFSSSDNCQSECYVPASASGKEIQIKCTLCSANSRKYNFIYENQIIKIEKDELLLVNGFKIDKCISLDFNLNLYFRQISSFKYYENLRKINFNFIGLTAQPINKKSNINLNLYLIYKDKKGNNKTEQDLTTASCTFNKTINLVQVLYICEIKTKNKNRKYSSLELSRYNNNIEGIPENETLLNPSKTDEAIKNGILGKLTENFFNSTLIKANNCHELNEFKITGNFDGIKF